MTPASVVIIGGGWAGLAAAVELTRAGHAIELFESAPQLGGRARSVDIASHTVDNGQHLLIGAYHATLALLQVLGLEPDKLFLRESLRLEVVRQDTTLALNAPALPAPLHLAWALLRAHGITPAERSAALAFCLHAYRQGFQIETDVSVAELLAAQPLSLVQALWEPLCLATLNTGLHEASAQVFLRVLRDTFVHRRRDSDLLQPRLDLGQILPQPAQQYIERHGGKVHTRRRVDALLVENDTLRGVVVGGVRHEARQVILATAPWHAATLVEPHAALQNLSHHLNGLGSAPISTLYLVYPPEVSLGQTMLGFAGTTVQWLIDRGRICGQPGLMAAVISGDGPHSSLSAERLMVQVTDEIATVYPHWPRPLQWKLIREQRATFRCNVGCQRLRPGHESALPGLWLAGDYTDTGYPATLEGAVRSGVQCARHIIGQHG